MAQFNAKDLIFQSFSKAQLKKAIDKLNQELFQKRCAPQRAIEAFDLITHQEFKLVCKIITEYRVELYVFYGAFDVPACIEDLQSASNSRGNTVKIEFNE